ncbi:hypothetical protein HHI36_015140 [Cryptolaemus montrouzieri]|uniref:Uncharacterized protein n=1 Tax=Cryptolaemus montrouzieri TaxID=559131 RepID=A0ABD2N5Y7_9CUCU
MQNSQFLVLEDQDLIQIAIDTLNPSSNNSLTDTSTINELNETFVICNNLDTDEMFTPLNNIPLFKVQNARVNQIEQYNVSDINVMESESSHVNYDVLTEITNEHEANAPENNTFSADDEQLNTSPETETENLSDVAPENEANCSGRNRRLKEKKRHLLGETYEGIRKNEGKHEWRKTVMGERCQSSKCRKTNGFLTNNPMRKD